MTHEDLEQLYHSMSAKFTDLNSRIVITESQYAALETRVARLELTYANHVLTLNDMLNGLMDRVGLLESKSRGGQLVTGNRDKGING